jgi:hypothetical protein
MSARFPRFVQLIAVVFIYGVLWACTGLFGTRAVRPLIRAGLLVDETVMELPDPGQVHDAQGSAYACRYTSYAPFLVTARWARSDPGFASAETELYFWFGRAIHVWSFKNSGWVREY